MNSFSVLSVHLSNSVCLLFVCLFSFILLHQKHRQNLPSHWAYCHSSRKTMKIRIMIRKGGRGKYNHEHSTKRRRKQINEGVQTTNKQNSRDAPKVPKNKGAPTLFVRSQNLMWFAVILSLVIIIIIIINWFEGKRQTGKV